MLIAKVTFTTNRQVRTEYMEVVRQGPVKFADGDDWVLLREMDKLLRRCDYVWISPSDPNVRVEWLRTTAFDRAS